MPGTIGPTLLRLLLVLSAASLSGQAPDPSRGFDDRVSVLEVEIPVRVTVRGEPLRGLEARDFVVLDEGVERPIVAFEEIDLSDPGEPAFESSSTAVTPPGVAASPGRHLLLLFDFTFSPPGWLPDALDAARTMVATQLHPRDRVGVAMLAANGADLLVGFSDDRERLEAAFDYLQAQLDRKPAALRAAVERLAAYRSDNLRDLSRAVGPEVALTFGDPTARVLRPFFEAETEASLIIDRVAELETLSETAFISTALARSVDLSSLRRINESFGALATLLRGVRGQKRLLLFSTGYQGFTDLVAGEPGVRSPFGAGVEVGPLAGPRGGDSRASGPTVAPDAPVMRAVTTPAWGTSAATTRTYESLTEAFRRSGWVIDAFDLAGTRPGFDNAALLFQSKETGGELYQNYNRLEQATSTMLERTSVSYLLVAQITDLPRSGSYRRFRVRLRSDAGAPATARVEARPGYHVPRPADQMTELERQLEDAEVLFRAPDRADLPVDLVAAVAPAAESAANVTLALRLPLAPWTADFRGRDLELFVQAFASPLGDWSLPIEDLFSQRLRIARRLLDRDEPLLFFGDLDVPAGEWQVRVRLAAPDLGLETLQTLSVSIPLASAERPWFPTPVVVSTAESSLLLMESAAALARTGRVDDRLLPVAGGRVPAGTEVLLLCQAAGPLPDELQVAAHFQDPEGRVTPIPVGVVRAMADADRAQFLVSAGLERLPPGPGRLTFVWTDADGRTVGESATALDLLPR